MHTHIHISNKYFCFQPFIIIPRALPSNAKVVIETCQDKKNKTFKNWSMPRGFPGGAVIKNLPANAADTGSSPGPGRSHMPWSN